MRIAVSYENGQVFQHFGRTEFFKVYDVEEGKVVSSEVISSNGTGHGALAGILAEQNVDVVICGGMGGGAQNALLQVGIEICAGAEGDADAAVEAYLNGELENAGVNCDHHHEEEQDCGCGDDCGCGSEGGCHGGCGGCGGHQTIAPIGPNAGKTCKVHYRGTFNDGTQFDSSYDRGETLDFVCGAGQMIPGFDLAVANMEVGQEIDIHLMPEEAYGPSDPAGIATIELSKLPGAEDLNVDEHVYLYNNYGQPIPVTVIAKDETTITFDANPPMAGKELNFHILLVDAQ